MKSLLELQQVIECRKSASPQRSYVAALLAGGIEKINAKISEEAQEVIAAAQSGDTTHLVHEVADLWFHSLVLLAARGESVEAVMAELDRRKGSSGIQKKNNRGK